MMCIAKSSNTILQSILNSVHYIRHKCINTGEVYYTYIIFDSFKHVLLLWKVSYHWMNVGPTV